MQTLPFSLPVCFDASIPVPDLFEGEDDSFVCRSAEVFKLNCFEDDPFQKITPRQLKELLTDPLSHGFDQIIILDARFDYEYKGGRILGAKNITSRSSLMSVYNRYINQKVCIVFHCEYSHNRGPTLMRLFRDIDRKQHLHSYPQLSYPDIFLLDGGYKRFYEEASDLCYGGYVPMRATEYIENGELRRCHSNYTQYMLEDESASLPSKKLKRRRSYGAAPFSDCELFESMGLDDENLLIGHLPFSASQ